MHLHRVTNDPHQNHHKLLLLSNSRKCNFHTIDCESPEDGSSASRPLPFKVRSENISIITSFNGLVCVGIKKLSYHHKYSYLMLWNPLTGDYKRLSKSNSRKECYDDEKLYLLKEGGRRTIDLSYSIIRFDTKTEKFTKIATPSLGVRRKACLSFTLLHKDRKLHLCVIYSFGEPKFRQFGAMLWRMDADGDWRKVVTYQMPRSFCFEEPLHLMRNGGWLTYCLYTGFHVYTVDLVRHLINEISNSNIANKMGITSSAKYIGTLWCHPIDR
ncbi:hypothetical protein L1887_34455 [Cichorium endivia]|nr:hypothetical protein L1887_34455 [Cichorium endivia]